MLEDKPNYYAIIPGNVRYDKELSPNAKLLYGEITALANSKGYCWATNKYFMELYNLSERTIQNLLKQLTDKKYIVSELISNSKRKIFIVDTPAKNCGVGVSKISGVPAKNCTHNNTNNNTTNGNNKKENLFDYNWLEDD